MNVESSGRILVQNIEDELTHDKLKHMEDIFLNADVDNIEGLSIDEFR